MTVRLATIIGFGGVVLGGAIMWARWGTLVWLDSAIAFCL